MSESSLPAGAPKDEIEISPAMIEAGAIRLGDLDGASLAYQAREVFLAMWAVHLASLKR